MSPPLPADDTGTPGRPADATAPDSPVVLFDMDGVLLAGRGAEAAVHDRALVDVLSDHGLVADIDPDTWELLAGHGYDTEFVDGCRRLGVDPVALFGRRERHAARRSVERLAAGCRTPYDDVAALVDLADRYTLGVVSNNYDRVVRFVVDHHDLGPFAHVRGRAPGVQGFFGRKPSPALLLDARDSLEMPGGPGGPAGFYVGDRGTDLTAATRAGLAGVLVRRPHNEDLTPPVEPALVVDSLTDLPARLPATSVSVGRP